MSDDAVTGQELELALTKQAQIIGSAFSDVMDRLMPEIRAAGKVAKTNNEKESHHLSLALFTITVTMILGVVGFQFLIWTSVTESLDNERKANASRHEVLFSLVDQNRKETQIHLQRLDRINDNRIMLLDEKIMDNTFWEFRKRGE